MKKYLNKLNRKQKIDGRVEIPAITNSAKIQTCKIINKSYLKNKKVLLQSIVKLAGNERNRQKETTASLVCGGRLPKAGRGWGGVGAQVGCRKWVAVGVEAKFSPWWVGRI